MFSNGSETWHQKVKHFDFLPRLVFIFPGGGGGLLKTDEKKFPLSAGYRFFQEKKGEEHQTLKCPT